MKKLLTILSVLALLVGSFLKYNQAVGQCHIEYRQGCCSWHGGVCGCNKGRGKLICCDGTLSPSCTCGH